MNALFEKPVVGCRKPANRLAHCRICLIESKLLEKSLIYLKFNLKKYIYPDKKF